MATKPICIDISHWQADPIDFHKIKASGVKAVIFKATQGLSYVDPTFVTRREAAHKAGLLTASYHYLEAGESADVPSQVQHYLSTVNPKPGERVILDVEDSNTTLNDVVEAVEQIINDPRTLQITIYSGAVIKQLLGDNTNDILAQNTSLWLAQYGTSDPTWPTAVWTTYSLWQYTDSGQVHGVVGPIDLDAFNGSDLNFVKWMLPATRKPPAPTPDPSSDVPVVEVTVNSDRPIQLRLIFGENVSPTLQHTM